MASLRKRGKVWYYRFVDADGASHERKGCPDRRETEGMAAAAVSPLGPWLGAELGGKTPDRWPEISAWNRPVDLRSRGPQRVVK